MAQDADAALDLLKDEKGILISWQEVCQADQTEITALLAQLAETPAPAEDNYPVSEELRIETGITLAESGYIESVDKLGEPSVLVCPECSGVLWELRDGELLRFRCHVGHAYAAKSLLASQSDAVEGALWTALRALEEKVALNRRMAQKSRQRDHIISVRRFEDNAREMERHADIIRQALRESERMKIE